MESCDKCLFYSKEYEDFRKMFDDTVILDDSDHEKKFCIMFDDNIPNEICYGGMKCPHFFEKKN
jgi:hypothetical protein